MRAAARSASIFSHDICELQLAVFMFSFLSPVQEWSPRVIPPPPVAPPSLHERLTAWSESRPVSRAGGIADRRRAGWFTKAQLLVEVTIWPPAADRSLASDLAQDLYCGKEEL